MVALDREIQNFLRDHGKTTMSLPPMEKESRKKVHLVSRLFRSLRWPVPSSSVSHENRSLNSLPSSHVLFRSLFFSSDSWPNATPSNQTPKAPAENDSPSSSRPLAPPSLPTGARSPASSAAVTALSRKPTGPPSRTNRTPCPVGRSTTTAVVGQEGSLAEEEEEGEGMMQRRGGKERWLESMRRCWGWRIWGIGCCPRWGGLREARLGGGRED